MDLEDIFSTSSARELFKVDDFEVDPFLYKHYRFTPLNDLKADLSQLHRQLNDELLGLINANFHEFVRLGSSLAGSLETCEAVRFDLAAFNARLGRLVAKLAKLHRQLGALQRHDRELLALKHQVHVVVVVNGLMRNGERLVRSVGPENWTENHPETWAHTTPKFQALVNVTLNLRQLVRQTSHPLVNRKQLHSLVLEVHQLMAQYRGRLAASSDAARTPHLFELYHYAKLLGPAE